jgi:uncharacterized protein YdeI (YjbR/CyaY-like superfamily)
LLPYFPKRTHPRRGAHLPELMAPILPDPKKIKSFRAASAFEKWLAANHGSETEIWLKVHKKDSGLATVTAQEALDVALCWGWIDGIRKGFDERSFLQRYTPRTPRSIWSQVNRDNIARLTTEGRMTAHGQAQVDAAKADGRWEAAYALGRMNLFALTFRTNNMKTPAGRARKIAQLVAMLERGETIVPERRR